MFAFQLMSESSMSKRKEKRKKKEKKCMRCTTNVLLRMSVVL